jgi:aldehyde:ferredoxin oxidoreductase
MYAAMGKLLSVNLESKNCTVEAEASADGGLRAEILSAEDLWGKDCYRTEDSLKERHGKDCEVACIGPAGDKGRFAAGSALGAVMGSKKLKAVVVKGNVPIRIADTECMKALRKQHLPVFREEFGSDLTEFGTPMFYEEALNSGDAPWKNWSSSIEEMKGFAVTAEKVKEYQLKRYAGSGCPVGCGGHVEVKQGSFKTEGPVHKAEYETMAMFGSNLLNDNLEVLDLARCLD